MTGISTLDLGIMMQMRDPSSIEKAGSVITNMKTADYTDEECNTVCKALFLDENDGEMTKAWKIFAKGKGSIEAKAFRAILPLLDNVPPEDMDALFSLAEVDDAGHISYSDFTMIIKSLNPQGNQVCKKEAGRGERSWYDLGF